VTEKGEHNWHADRPGAEETEYRRLKVMMYLEPTTKEQGAFRVIPGSHRMPFHEWLWPLQANHFKDGTIGASFGLTGEEVPACIVETLPGDVVFFHHSLFHAAYGKFRTRRYIAFKFVTPPDSDAKLRSMLKYAAGAFDIDPALLERPRLRPLVEALPGLGEQARALA
jgi:ectoine hydroxylase-related dioxygenase (phytanoyl-CoA dioxygenase family)